MKAIEIEYKFAISMEDVSHIRETLARLSTHTKPYDKRDRYFRKGNSLSSDSKEKEGASSADEFRVRLREELSHSPSSDKKVSHILSFKNRNQHREGADGAGEINEEYETEVSDIEVMEELLTQLGFQTYVSKHKEGNSYRIPFSVSEVYDRISRLANSSFLEEAYITAELSKVDMLGYYLELEIIVEKEHDSTLTALLQELLRDLAYNILDIDASQLETRPYTLMIEEALSR